MNDGFKVTDVMPLVQTPSAKIVQYQIGTGGLIDRLEERRLLTRIDTLEFSKWQYKTIDQVTSWYDVFDVPWACFACCSMVAKHCQEALDNVRMNVLMVRTGIYLLLGSCAKIFC